MISANLNTNFNGLMFVSVTSTSQILNASSKIDLVQPSSQNAPVLPRVPGTGKEYVLQIAPDFDDALEIGL